MESMKSLLAEYIEAEFEKYIQQQVYHLVKNVDINLFINNAVELYFNKYGVDSSLVEENFEERINQSVKQKLIGSNIQWGNFKLSGDLVRGGTIKSFSSTGIVDQAHDIEFVVKDNEVYVENKLISREINVVEDVKINGNLTVEGNISGNTKFVSEIKEQIKEDLSDHIEQTFKNLNLPLDSTLCIDGKSIISATELGPSITKSNIRSLGLVKELEVSGEASLAETLLVTTTGRVGINTIEPDSVLTVWDDEIKINIKKISKKHGYIGVANNQSLNLGIDDNIKLKIHDKGISIDGTLKLKERTLTYSNSLPNHQDVIGSICFNSMPKQGKPIGWVCLGNYQWAEFGTIK